MLFIKKTIATLNKLISNQTFMLLTVIALHSLFIVYCMSQPGRTSDFKVARKSEFVWK